MLVINKNKILYFPGNGKRYRNLTRIKGGMFKKLNDFVEIEDDVTFGDFFKLLIKEKEMINLIFGASLAGVPFELLIKDFKKKNCNKDNEIRYLEFYWFTSNFDDELEIAPSIAGISKNEDADYGISIEFVPICELQDIPLRLNEEFTIYDEPFSINIDNIILKTTKKFTLYEIIHAILYELTWHGTPEMRETKRKKILSEIKKKE